MAVDVVGSLLASKGVIAKGVSEGVTEGAAVDGGDGVGDGFAKAPAEQDVKVFRGEV